MIRYYFVCCLSVLLTGCSLSPLYGGEHNRDTISIGLNLKTGANYRFLAWELDRRLNIHDDSDYVLTITLAEDRDNIFIQSNTVARQARLSIRADFFLQKDDRIILKRIFHEASPYAIGSNSYADDSAATRTRQNILRILADRIAIQLMTFISPT